MTPEEYTKAATRTTSDQWHGEDVAYIDFMQALTNCMMHLKHLDGIKKALFYGRNLEAFKPDLGEPNCLLIWKKLDESFQKRQENIDFIHGIIGKATEAGELLEMLLKTMTGGKFDRVNMIEEIGDGNWYDAILANAAKATFPEIWDRNIQKLKARFPEKFTEEAANVRNLEVEREILEKGA